MYILDGVNEQTVSYILKIVLKNQLFKILLNYC